MCNRNHLSRTDYSASRTYIGIYTLALSFTSQHYPRTVWKNSYAAEHEVTGKTYN